MHDRHQADDPGPATQQAEQRTAHPVLRRRSAPVSLAGMTTELQRDTTLRRRIGPLALAATVVNGVVGAGIFTLPAAMAHAAGARAPLAYLVCAIAMSFVVVCFAEAGSRLPTSGGVYGTVRVASGPLTGFVCGS